MNVDLRPDSLNLISVCTGGGGLDLGVELAIPNARPVVLVEGEAWSAATLVSAMEARIMAPAPLWSDVRTFDGRPWRGVVDGLIGGIPCQPHSLAGKREGADDERDLWSPTRRIIVQAGVRIVLIENVRGMLSAKEDHTAGAERVWRDLRRLGFEVEGGLFTAAEIGASHERERIFIFAVADDEDWRWSRRKSSAGCFESQGALGRYRSDVGHSNGARLEGWRGRPDERTRERSIGSDGRELVDASGERRGERRTQPEFRRGRDTVARASSNVVDAIGRGHDRITEVPIRGPLGRAAFEWSGGDRFPALYPPRPSDIDGWRRVLENSPHLEPAVRRMADGVAARLDLAGPHAARIERLRMLGNGVVPLQAAYALRTLATRLAGRNAGAARLVRMMAA